MDVILYLAGFRTRRHRRQQPHSDAHRADSMRRRLPTNNRTEPAIQLVAPNNEEANHTIEEARDVDLPDTPNAGVPEANSSTSLEIKLNDLIELVTSLTASIVTRPENIGFAHSSTGLVINTSTTERAINEHQPTDGLVEATAAPQQVNNPNTPGQIPPVAGQGSSLKEQMDSLAVIVTFLVLMLAERAQAPVPPEAPAAGPVEASAQEKTMPPCSQDRTETAQTSPQADKTSTDSASTSTKSTQLPYTLDEPRRASTEPPLQATKIKLPMSDQHQQSKKKHNTASVFILLGLTDLLVYFSSVRVVVECLVFPVILFALYLCFGKSACFCSWTWRPRIRKEQVKAAWAQLTGGGVGVGLETGNEERKARGG